MAKLPRWFRKLSPRFFKRQSVGHQIPGVPYRVVTSYRGMRYMVNRLGKKWLDRDLRKSADGTIWVIHWPIPGRKGEYMRSKKIKANTSVEHMTDAQIRSLSSPDGYKYHTLLEDIRELDRLNAGAYIEPKANYFTLNDFLWIRKVCLAHGVGLRGYSFHPDMVKLMNQAHIPAKTLKRKK